jgi:hypothetical protein
MRRVSTEVTLWHSAEYGSDFRRNSGEIPRNSAEFRGISPELSRNLFGSQKIPRNSVSAEFRGHPSYAAIWASFISIKVSGYGELIYAGGGSDFRSRGSTPPPPSPPPYLQPLIYSIW